jgi:lysophospholipase L1-like esterase
VLNAGVPGYVSWQEALSYALYLRELSPAWIISLDGVNDIVSAIVNGRAGTPALYRTVERAYLGTEANPLEPLAGWLLGAARELRTARAFERLRPKPLSAYGPPPPAEVGAQLGAATAYLNHAAQREGARVFTVLQPLAVLPDTKPLTEFERRVVAEHDHRMPGRNAYYTQSYAAMRAALAELARGGAGGLLWLDATDAFADTSEIAYTDDCHLTPLGQQQLAERIAAGWIAALR